MPVTDIDSTCTQSDSLAERRHRRFHFERPSSKLTASAHNDVNLSTLWQDDKCTMSEWFDWILTKAPRKREGASRSLLSATESNHNRALTTTSEQHKEGTSGVEMNWIELQSWALESWSVDLSSYSYMSEWAPVVLKRWMQEHSLMVIKVGSKQWGRWIQDRSTQDLVNCFCFDYEQLPDALLKATLFNRAYKDKAIHVLVHQQWVVGLLVDSVRQLSNHSANVSAPNHDGQAINPFSFLHRCHLIEHVHVGKPLLIQQQTTTTGSKQLMETKVLQVTSLPEQRTLIKCLKGEHQFLYKVVEKKHLQTVALKDIDLRLLMHLQVMLNDFSSSSCVLMCNQVSLPWHRDHTDQIDMDQCEHATRVLKFQPCRDRDGNLYSFSERCVTLVRWSPSITEQWLMLKELCTVRHSEREDICVPGSVE